MKMAEIRTGVPYNPDMMAEIYENGAIVDLSKVNFPTCKSLKENMPPFAKILWWMPSWRRNLLSAG